MAFKDNRDFMDALSKTGDLVKVKQEVDWDAEAGAISRHALELSGPAILFEKLKDYATGYRIFAGPLGTYRRVALALGLPADTPIKKIYEVFEERQQKPISPVVVKNAKAAPCKENIMLGEDVDLYRFPIPMCHDGDGGRYIGTWDTVVTKDPDSDWVNWGMYRFMIINKKSLSGAPAPTSHLGLMLKKYVEKGLPMPVAIVVGSDPISALVTSTGYQIGDTEANFAGALRQEPVELVKCETNNLLVPAHSEIVIEGEIMPDRMAYEGPFGEYPGYRTGEHGLRMFCHVTAITYRNSPIITMSNLGVPPDDSSVGGSMGVAIGLKNRLQRKGLPVIDVYLPPEGASHLVVVSVKKGGNEVAKAVKEAITRRRAWYTKIIVVNDDVDIYNLGEVVHAFSVKCHSTRGVFVSDEPGKGSSATPCYTLEEKHNNTLGAVALFDATWPLDWREEDIPIKSSFNVIYPKNVQDKVLKNWKKYGF